MSTEREELPELEEMVDIKKMRVTGFGGYMISCTRL